MLVRERAVPSQEPLRQWLGVGPRVGASDNVWVITWRDFIGYLLRGVMNWWDPPKKDLLFGSWGAYSREVQCYFSPPILGKQFLFRNSSFFFSFFFPFLISIMV